MFENNDTHGWRCKNKTACIDLSETRSAERYLESGRTGSAGVSMGTWGALWKKSGKHKQTVIELSINLHIGVKKK